MRFFSGPEEGDNISSEHFYWSFASGPDSVQGVQWLKDKGSPYLEQAYHTIRDKILQLPDPPRLPIKVTIRESRECSGGIGGGTSGGELSYCAGTWGDNQFCYGLLGHELCNLFTGELVTPGWPTAWWANHRSPFPTVIANEIIRTLVPKYYRAWGDYGDPLVQMFDSIYGRFENIFPKMLNKMREVRVRLEGATDPYLSHIVYYFLFWSARERLDDYLVVPPMPRVDESLLRRLEQTYGLHVV